MYIINNNPSPRPTAGLGVGLAAYGVAGGVQPAVAGGALDDELAVAVGLGAHAARDERGAGRALGVVVAPARRVARAAHEAAAAARAAPGAARHVRQRGARAVRVPRRVAVVAQHQQRLVAARAAALAHRAVQAPPAQAHYHLGHLCVSSVKCLTLYPIQGAARYVVNKPEKGYLTGHD